MLSIHEELRKQPFVKIVIPFLLGCVLGRYFCEQYQIAFILAFVFILILAIFSFFKIGAKYHLSSWWTIILIFLLFNAGFALAGRNVSESILPEGCLNAKSVLVKVAEIPLKTNNQTRFTAHLLAFEHEKKWVDAEVDVKVTIDSAVTNLDPGTIVLIKSKVQEMPLPLSPMQFNFKEYNKLKGIVGQLFVKAEKVQFLTTSNNLWYSMLQLREKLVKRLTVYQFNDNESSVLSSMVLGYASEMNPDLRNAFANAGVMHILSVSGMHVAIVFGFLMFLLKFMNGNKKIETARSIIIILFLWFYALLTGFSSPVIRSAAIFSFIALGRVFNRSGSPFNTLAASAFIILLISPLQVFDIGFQFSYAAMIGIFLFYEAMETVFVSRWWIANYAWQLTALSIAATIGALPISLYYFHQFPTYFIITNLLVVPLSAFVLYGGIVLLAVSFSPFLYDAVGWLVDKLVWLLNCVVYQTDVLPGVVISNIRFGLLELFCFYGFIAFLLLWLKTKSQYWFLATMLTVLIFVCNISFQSILHANKEQILVYNSSRPAASIIIDNKMVTIVDSADVARIEKANTNYRLNYNIENQIFIKKDILTETQDTILYGIKFRNIAGKAIVGQFKKTDFIFVSSNYHRTIECNKFNKLDFVFVSRQQKFMDSENVELMENSWFYFGKPTRNLDSLRTSKMYFTASKGTFIKDL